MVFISYFREKTEMNATQNSIGSDEDARKYLICIYDVSSVLNSCSFDDKALVEFSNFPSK